MLGKSTRNKTLQKKSYSNIAEVSFEYFDKSKHQNPVRTGKKVPESCTWDVSQCSYKLGKCLNLTKQT